MNILHVVNIYFVLPYFIGDQFKHFSDKGHKLNVVCSKSPYLEDYSKKQGFDYIETEVNRSISIKDDLRTIYRICNYIRKQKIDVVVGHTPKGALLGMLAARLMRVPKRIYFRHGLVYETSKGFQKKLLISIDKFTSFCATDIVCVSPSVLQRSIEDGLGARHKHLILNKGTCNGVDSKVKFNSKYIDQNKLGNLRRHWGINDDDWVIGYTGRLVKDKGIIPLISAFEILKKEDPRYRLLLVGMFEERDALPKKVKDKIKNDDQIIWTDFVNEDIQYYYSLMNIYALLSYREGFGTGIIEAQSMSIPVITTKVTGCCDAIIDTETGFFTSHDPIDIANKIRYIKEGNIENELGNSGRKWVVENFDSQIVWKDIEKLILK